MELHWLIDQGCKQQGEENPFNQEIYMVKMELGVCAGVGNDMKEQFRIKVMLMLMSLKKM